MIKETIICLVIVIGIFFLEFYTQSFTTKAVSEITQLFDVIKEDIAKQEVDHMKIDIDNMWSNWEEKQKKLAFYIEHDELEKVHTSIVKLKSYVDTENFSEAMAELEDGKFVIEHIQEKNSFNLQNIF